MKLQSCVTYLLIPSMMSEETLTLLCKFNKETLIIIITNVYVVHTLCQALC